MAEQGNSEGVDLQLTALAARTWARRPGRISQRIAVFTPMPPEETGIANFSLKLHMADPGKYDVIADVRSPSVYAAQRKLNGRNYNVIPYGFYCQELRRTQEHLARIFVIGNSPFHDFAVREAINTRGTENRYLYLHEALIHGALLNWAKEAGLSPIDYLRKWYPEKAEALDRFGPDCEWNSYCQKNGMFGVRPLVALTGIRRIIVNNSRCRRLVYEDLRPQDRVSVKVDQLFLPIERRSGIGRVAFAKSDGAKVVGSFGSPSAIKGTPLIVEAVRHLNEQGCKCRLLLAGYGAKAFVQGLAERDRAFCFVPDGIEDLDRFHSLMASVDVAVQLRLGEHGESSGCVCELLGIGTPLVTNSGFVDPELSDLCQCVSPQPSSAELEKAIRSALQNRRNRAAYGKRLAGFSFRAASDGLVRLVERGNSRQLLGRKILVDALQFDGHGIQRATDALYSALKPVCPDVEIVYLCSKDRPDVSSVPHRRIVIDPGRRDDEIRATVAAEKPDIIHFPFNGNPPGGLKEVSPQTRIVATIHDIIPLKIPQVLCWPEAAVEKFRAEIDVTLRLSDEIFCDSRYTLHDLVETFGADERRLHCLYFAPMVDICGREEPCDEVKAPFFLYNGGYCRRKGIELLVENFLKLKRAGRLKSTLVMTGHPWAWDEVIKANLDEGRKKGWILELGYVSDEKLLWLFRHAVAMAYPSLYEGFGLPPLEAMNLGCPALVARTSSLPEICDDAACYLEDRLNSDEFCSALLRVETDAAYRNELIRRGRIRAAQFSWESTVQAFRAVVERQS